MLQVTSSGSVNIRENISIDLVSNADESVAPRCRMTAHSVGENEWRRPLAHRGTRNGLLQLGWSHFWLLISILGGMLGLVVLIFAAAHRSAL